MKTENWHVKATICKNLLETWLTHPFFELSPPKTTGREMFGTIFADACIQQIKRQKAFQNMMDLPHSPALTVESITQYYKHFVEAKSPLDILYVSGGGAQNPLIMSSLAETFDPIPVVDVTEKGISG